MAWSWAVTAAEHSGHFSTEAVRFPVFVQHLEGVGSHAADGGAGGSADGKGWADRRRSGGPEHALEPVDQGWDLPDLFGTTLVPHGSLPPTDAINACRVLRLVTWEASITPGEDAGGPDLPGMRSARSASRGARRPGHMTTLDLLTMYPRLGA